MIDAGDRDKAPEVRRREPSSHDQRRSEARHLYESSNEQMWRSRSVKDIRGKQARVSSKEHQHESRLEKRRKKHPTRSPFGQFI